MGVGVARGRTGDPQETILKIFLYVQCHLPLTNLALTYNPTPHATS